MLKKQLQKGSMTIEAALLMPVLLLVLMSVLYLFFYVHNRAWLTAAAYEAALSGSMEAVVPEGSCETIALEQAKALGDTGFFGSKDLKIQVSAGKTIQVTYDLDTFSVYGGFGSHLQIQETVKVINPVSWIRKAKSTSESIRGE